MHEGSCGADIAIVPFGTESWGNGTFTENYLDDNDRREYELALGYCPTTEIQFACNCNSNARLDHLIVARLAASLARRHNGAVDIDYAANRALHQYGIKAGRAYPLNLHTPAEQYYLVDADFFDAWINHPKFWLVK